MPYLMETKTGTAAREACARPKPFGPGVTGPGIVQVDIWGSSFKDLGNDWCEFRITYCNGHKEIVRIAGY